MKAQGGRVAATSEQVDTLLLFVCGGLTLLVPPGLAFFVGGLSGRAPAARAFLFTLTGTAITLVLGFLGGYGMLVGDPLLAHVVGRPSFDLAGERGAAGSNGLSPYPLAKAGALLSASSVAVAIVGAAVASRITLRAWMVFAVAWSMLVLYPVGYGVFALDDGWAGGVLRVIDFGGALPIAVAAGAAAAGVLLACGPGEQQKPSKRSLPSIVIGGTFLCAGWLGLTTGSEGAVDAYTALIAINSFLASAGGCLAWMVVDRVLSRRPMAMSALCGVFAGLVAITSAAGVLTLGWSLLLGAIAALACATTVAVAARVRFGPPTTLIVITIVASLVGLLYIGLFARGEGMIDSGNFDLFTVQGIAGFAVLIASFVVSLGLALVLRYTMGLTRVRASASSEPTRERDRQPVLPFGTVGGWLSRFSRPGAHATEQVTPRRLSWNRASGNSLSDRDLE